MYQEPETAQEDAFILQHRETIARCAAYLFKRFPVDGLTLDDFKVEVAIAFLQAKRQFNPEKGCTIVNFAQLVARRQIINLWKPAERRKKNLVISSSYEQPHANDVYWLPLIERIADADAVIPGQQYCVTDFQEAQLQNCKNFLLLCSRLERAVLGLIFVDARTYEETAQELKVKPKSVDNAISRINRKIKFYLEKLKNER